MRYNSVINRKLALLDSQVGKLETHLKNVSCSEFSESWVLRSMAERALQVAIEIVIDIAERIIAIEGAGPVATARDAIRKLTELKILANEQPYVKMVRFRNLIVHEYEEIDPKMLFELATSRLTDFTDFRVEIDYAQEANGPSSP